MTQRLRLTLLGLVLVVASFLTPNRAQAINCTFRFCAYSNPCPGVIIINSVCCPPGSGVQCAIVYDLSVPCVENVIAGCT